jgi:hypothetical protein
LNNPDLLEAIYLYGNLAEALIWFGFAVRFLLKSVRSHRRNSAHITQLDRWTAFTFLVFGCSDLVEMKTLAWWRPWWLFLWKASCVLGLLLLVLKYNQHKQKNR